MGGVRTNALQKLTGVLAIIMAIWSVAYVAHLRSYLGINVAPPSAPGYFLGACIGFDFFVLSGQKRNAP